MCGITGIFDYRQSGARWADAALKKMIDGVAHRGPDGRGSFHDSGIFLGHTRLAVLDLSALGNQPMHSASGRFVISFNGEIYNFRELQRELAADGRHFKSCSDTEVILAAWEKWGLECLSHFDGIFALAIYDRNARKLYLARDPVGVKPLYYYDTGKLTFFASEPPALFGELLPRPTIDLKALDQYFTFNYVPGRLSGHSNVFSLEPGVCREWSADGTRDHRFWSLRYAETTGVYEKAQQEQFSEIVRSSVQQQLVADAPLGVFLSGGLDSYAVSRAAREKKPALSAFTLAFAEREFDERADATEYAQYLKLEQRVAQFSWNEIEIESALRSMRELHADASSFPMFQLCRFARTYTTVALSGDGGDELLAGYETYRAGAITPYLHALPRAIRRALIACAGLLPNDHQRYGLRMVAQRLLNAADEPRGRDHCSLRRIFSVGLKARLYSREFSAVSSAQDPIGEYERLMLEVPVSRSYLCARQHADFMFHLPSILQKVDRMSMAHGLEVRVPLLSKKMVEFCANLSDQAKRHGASGKVILRDSLSSDIPAKALDRKKAGFLPPVDAWFRKKGPANSIFGDLLMSARSSAGYLDWVEVEKAWKEHQDGKIDAGFALLGVLQFMNWSRM